MVVSMFQGCSWHFLTNGFDRLVATCQAPKQRWTCLSLKRTTRCACCADARCVIFIYFPYMQVTWSPKWFIKVYKYYINAHLTPGHPLLGKRRVVCLQGNMANYVIIYKESSIMSYKEHTLDPPARMQVQQRYMKMHCEHPKADRLQVAKHASNCYRC